MMSLLGDSLTKAERNGRRIEPGTAPIGAALCPGESVAGIEAPSASQAMQPNRDFAPHGDELSRLVHGVAPDRTAAGVPQPLVDAPTAGHGAALNPGRRGPVFRYVGMGAAGAVAVLAIAAYIWTQLQQSAGNIAPGLALQPALDARTAQTATPDVSPPVAQPAPGTAPSLPAPQISATVAGRSAAAATAAAAGPAEGNSPRERATPPPSGSGQSLSARLSGEASPNAADAPLPVRVGSSPARVNPGVAAAYQAFQDGDLTAARSAYEQVLRSEPRNSDALHGLAAIAVREDRADIAENYHMRALEADPKDTLAQAGLLDLKAHADTEHSESRLKSLLATQPDSPFLNFSLGNFYARHGRWAEAQQAYFRAWVGDAGNPDYLFNLAVSLDQLRQAGLALQYYEKALAAAGARAGAFDRGQVMARVEELRQ